MNKKTAFTAGQKSRRKTVLKTANSCINVTLAKNNL